ncbi:ParB/RepB/Spo0J family partition protein [Paludicola sp. MB14-C6]|uniref:ParB/RepB/Spo0J family partition protein n=1 Tax=Paludihabitans sp. MB14-C6 TaxID=3070656 RepID=UPI0027DCF653|nr:ParB/RepB/Spo0J family partition protein [Paludicola sp. MB14-C6]WMJ21779.1 ParB/RepB/Spo0J family partition protein [Paludicola sp. MB14-C6]
MASNGKLKEINRVVLIDTELIVPNPAQPRSTFSQKDLESLADSIKVNGLLQPITVRRVDSHFELISGERRLRACKIANMRTIPSIIVDMTDKDSAVIALIENLQRTDLNYFEEAIALKNLIVEWGVSQTELGERLGKAQSTIANKLRLLRFDELTQNLILGNQLTERQARALLKLTDDSKIFNAIEYISAHKLSSLQTEKYVDALVNAKPIHTQHSKLVVKDIRLFFNTINNAIKVMNQSGIPASAQKIESGDFIEYVVKIPLVN